MGRNCTLLLNVPPDRRGLIADPDLAALAGMRERLDQCVRPRPGGRCDGRDGRSHDHASTVAPRARSIAWCPGGHPRGQHIAGFVVEAESAGTGRRIATGSTVGYKRILPVPLTTARAVRVTVLDAHGTPRISRVSLHRAE